MKGYAGKILLVDLSKEEIGVREDGLARLYKGFIGGKGVGAKLLFELTKPREDPLSPDNPAVFIAGPAEGTLFPAANRLAAIFKSPLTGILGESYCGGYIGTEMKRAGLDGIVVLGRAEGPKYLLVEDGRAELRDASWLWGKDTYETETALKKKHGSDVQVMCIGPAGEKLVRFACLSHDRGRQFGRVGAGAVLGSKKLKAVVIKGSGSVEIADEEGLDELRKRIIETVRRTHRGLTKYGTPAISTLTNEMGALPTRYWEDGSFEGFERIGPDILLERHYRRNKACFACPIACGKISAVKEGKYRGAVVEGPEYESWFALGPLCYVDDPSAIIRASEICDRLGMDTISTGNVVAFALYLKERGVLATGRVGFDARFGDPDAVLRLVEMIGRREGIGDLLAEGVRRAAERIGGGAEELAVHVKGLEPPGYDPRALKSVALAYAVSCRGACHLRHVAYRPDLTGKHPFDPRREVDRHSYDKAEMIIELEDFYAVVDSMILCKFYCLPATGPILWDEMSQIYKSITGRETDPKGLREIGRRINTLIRSYNLREGMKPEDDVLPRRLTREPLRGGTPSREVVDDRRLKEEVDKYYQLRGWPNGIPRSDRV